MGDRRAGREVRRTLSRALGLRDDDAGELGADQRLDEGAERGFPPGEEEDGFRGAGRGLDP